MQKLFCLASCKWRDAQRAIRNFSTLYIYRLYTIGAYLEVRASLFTFGIYSATGTSLKMFGFRVTPLWEGERLGA